MIGDFQSHQFEGVHDPARLQSTYAEAALVVLDRLRAHAPAIRTLYGLYESARDEAQVSSREYEAAIPIFLAADPHDDGARVTFGDIADRNYYEFFYGPAVMASSVVAAAYDIVHWADRYVIRSKIKKHPFGVTVGKNQSGRIPGAPFGNAMVALRHHAAHFEEWVDPTTRETEKARSSWRILRQLGYKLPLGNTSVIDEALGKIAGSADEFLSRLAGSVLDLAHIAQSEGSAPISDLELYNRAKLGST